MFMIEIDMRKILSPDKKHQEKFIHDQLEELREIKRDPALTEEELKHEELLVHDFVDLYNYYYNLWLAKQKNEDKDLSQFIPQTIEIRITSPEREPHKKPRFSFLDEEEVTADGE